MNTKLRAHHETHNGEFADPTKARFTGAADPMKIQLSISYELSHNGAYASDTVKANAGMETT